MTRGSPPRLAQWLLQALLRGEVGRAWVEELHELYDEDVRALGLRAARRRYAFEAISLVVRWTLHRLTHGVRRPRAGGKPWPSRREGTGGSIAFDFLRELRYAIRRAARRPTATFAVAASLALGIGANAAVYAVLRGVVLAPYDLPELDRLVVLTRGNPEQGRSGWPVPPQEFRDWSAEATSFSGMAASQLSSATLTSEGDAVRLVKRNVTANYFEVVGGSLTLGRAPTESETFEEGPKVAVLSYRVWRDHFGADLAVVGRTMLLDGLQTEVIGVASSGFDYPEGTDLWMPLQLPGALAESRTFHTLHVVARLAPESSPESARNEMSLISARLEAAYPESNLGVHAEVARLADSGIGSLAHGLAAVSAGAGLVLLLTCLNLSVLLFVASLEGVRERAVRTALGATRSRLLAAVAADALLLCGAALGLGLPMAAGVLEVIRSGPGQVLPHATRIGFGPEVLLFVVGLTVVACAFCLAAPAWHALRRTDGTSLRNRPSGWGVGAVHARRWLIAVEMALALVTLFGAGLLVRTYSAYTAVDTGIDGGNGLFFTVTLPGSAYPPGSEESVGLLARLYQELGELPGVEAAGGSAWMPWLGPVAQVNYTLDGGNGLVDAEKPVGHVQTVGGDYFAATGIEVVRGRGFLPSDRADAQRVAIVSEAFVRAEGLEGRALGGTVFIELGPPEQWERTIVGVVEDVPIQALNEASLPATYVPLAQVPWNTQEILLRTAGDPGPLLPLVRRALAGLDPSLPAYGVTTLEGVIAATTAQPRVQMRLLLGFAILALALSWVGAYGVLSFVVATRSREFGVRLAVGATHRDVRTLVLREGLTAVGAGVVGGGLLALLVGRLLESVLFGVEPNDPLVMGVAAVVVLSSGVLSALGPGLRAGRVDPRVALAGAE